MRSIVAYPKYLRDCARKMRIEKKLTIDELAYRLKLPRTTIFYWVKDIPIPTTANQTKAARRAGEVSRLKHQRLRQEAYERGRLEFDLLAKHPSFRDFICRYIGQGYKRSRNVVQICNSDAAVMKLSHRWLSRCSEKPLVFRFQHHADQDPAEVQSYWGGMLGVDPSEIRVLAIEVYDTLLRARLQAWIDRLHDEWTSSNSRRIAPTGRSAAW